MNKLYRYTGNVSCHNIDHKGRVAHMDMVVRDIYDDSKAPTRLEVFGQLAEYINDLSWTDSEEKYLKKIFVYDDLLWLRYIIIPAANGRIPAKIIAMADVFDPNAETFGPKDYIEDYEPEQMSPEELDRFIYWKNDHELYEYNI